MKSERPIQRHKALVPFSKDHHFGLLLAWKIRQGLSRNIEPVRISNYVQYFFAQDLEGHFTEEEQHLFPLLPADDPMRIQAEAEHASIRRLVGEIAKDKSDASLLLEFADQLQAHIRFEERILFNHMQTSLAEQDLQIGYEESVPRKDIDAEWFDIFWSRDRNSL
jgi:hypothetical protein